MATSTDFVKQRDTFRCVPIAFINSMKWSGVEFSAKQWLKQISNEMQTTHEGTYLDYALPVMKQYAQGIYKFGRKKNNPTIEDIKKSLREGHALFLFHILPFEDVLHMSFISGMENEKFLLVNSFVDSKSNTKTVFKCSEKLFQTRVLQRNKKKKNVISIIPLRKVQ